MIKDIHSVCLKPDSNDEIYKIFFAWSCDANSFFYPLEIRFKADTLTKKLRCPSLWLRFLNKSSCIFTKRRYLMLEEIGVIRSTINGCVSLYLCDCWKSHLTEIRFLLLS